MLRKEITYNDFDGVERTEEFYFHITEPELIRFSFTKEGTLEDTLRQISKTTDNRKLLELFQDIILSSLGEKSPDGRKFIKSQELRDDFASTNAFSTLYLEFFRDADAAAAFVRGILPSIEGSPQDLLPAAE